jgi:hypothetical protein
VHASSSLWVSRFGRLGLRHLLPSTDEFSFFTVLSILNYRFEQRIGTAGIVGSSPLLTIGYASVTIVHQIVALWRESFGRPIGLWGLRSKIVWVCGDLFFIALW